MCLYANESQTATLNVVDMGNEDAAATVGMNLESVIDWKRIVEMYYLTNGKKGPT